MFNSPSLNRLVQRDGLSPRRAFHARRAAIRFIRAATDEGHNMGAISDLRIESGLITFDCMMGTISIGPVRS